MKAFYLLLICSLFWAALFADEVTVGTGINTDFIPINNTAFSSLYECIYYPAETRIPYGSTISGVRFYAAPYQYGGECLNHQTKIWIGTTNQTTLNNWVVPSAMTLVFDGSVTINLDQPVDFAFSTPYTYNSGNLVLYVYRPYPNTSVVSMGGNPFKVQQTTNMRAKSATVTGMTPSNLNPSAPPITVPTALFPKTTFTYTHATLTNDLDCMQISGNLMPELNLSTLFSITIKNKGTAAQSSYLVKLYNDANQELAAVAGPALTAGQTVTVNIPLTPTVLGNAVFYAKTVLATDTFVHNNRTTNNLSVRVMPQRTSQYTIGQGGQRARLPIDANTAQTLFETIFPASDFTYRGFIYGVRFYSDYVNMATDQSIQIWVGETDSQNLEQGWINNTGLQGCYSNLVNIYPGLNTLDCYFDTPFEYKGGNLVLMLFRGVSSSTGMTTNDYFVTQTIPGSYRTRLRSAISSMDLLDPANPPTNALPIHNYPQTTFFFQPGPAAPVNFIVNRTGGTIQVDWDDVILDGAGNALTDVIYHTYAGVNPEFTCDANTFYDTVTDSQIAIDSEALGADKLFFRITAVKQ